MPVINFFQKNMACLKECHPSLFEAMKALDDIPAITLSKNQDGQFDISCNFNNGSSSVFYGHSPLDFSKDLMKKCDLKNPRIIIFLGIGLGYHLIEFAKKPHPLTQAILAIEPLPHVFKKALEVSDLTPLLKSPHIRWLIGNDPHQIKKFLWSFFAKPPWLDYANAIEYVPLPPSIKMYPNFFKDVQSLVPQAIAHQFNRYFSDPFDAYRGTSNILENIPLFSSIPLLDAAHGVFQGKPGILVSSGPSLTKSLPFLKEVQNRAVMIACPSALPVLLQNNIHPHLWLNLERDEGQGTFFKNLVSKPPHFFIAPPLVHPQCFSGNGGKNIGLLGSSLQSRWLKLPNAQISDLGHSSAHTAFLILQRLGCNSIFLIGQDLSYHDSLSHAQGTWEESHRLMKHFNDQGKKIIPVEGNNGEPVKTNIFWHSFLQTFTEEFIPNYSGTIYNVIPLEYGAKIKGTHRIDPTALKEKLGEPFEILKMLTETFEKPQNLPPSEWLEGRKNQCEATVTILKKLETDMKAFAVDCKKTLFSHTIASKNWELAERDYKSFLEKAGSFFNRYSQNAHFEQDRFDYHEFFFPIIQGLMIQSRIDFYTQSGDVGGDFKEITRKLEILFNLSKDIAFWASACQSLLEETIRSLQKAVNDPVAINPNYNLALPS